MQSHCASAADRVISGYEAGDGRIIEWSGAGLRGLEGGDIASVRAQAPRRTHLAPWLFLPCRFA